MGRRTDRARTPGLWIAANELPTTGGHPFYQRLNQVLDAHGFDAFVESQCAPFYTDGVGRPSLTPGTYFRLLLIGYFEGIDSERGIAWRTATPWRCGASWAWGSTKCPLSTRRSRAWGERRRALTRWCVARGEGAAPCTGRRCGPGGAARHAASPVRAAPDRRPAGRQRRAVPAR